MSLHGTTEGSSPASSSAEEDRLGRLEQRLERLEATLARIEGALEHAPRVAALAGAAERQAREREAELESRLQTALTFIERLSAPATMQLMTDLADRSVDLSQLLRLLDQAPGLIATVVDTLDGIALRLGDSGVDLHARAVAAGRLAERVSAAVATAGTSAPVGVWGLLRALSDPDVQRAVGLTLHVVKSLGALADGKTAKALPPVTA